MKRRRWRLLRAYIDLFLVELGLRIRGFQWVERRVERGAQTSRPVLHDDVRRARRYARSIETAARQHVVHAECLHRSLVLQAWLRREFLPSTLQIGVRKLNGELKAHAWVELAGQVVNDEPSAVAPFAVLSSVSGTLPWS